MEEWMEAPAIYTLDLFPKNVTYGTFDLKARNLSAMEFLFLDSPPRFLELQRKFLRILARMACYYPYSHLIVNYRMHLFPTTKASGTRRKANTTATRTWNTSTQYSRRRRPLSRWPGSTT